MNESRWPTWVVLHVPHDSTAIPEVVRRQFVLDDQELRDELVRITDHHTLEIFRSSIDDRQVIRSPVSRLVVDVERFPEDAKEPMAARGMGAIYRKTTLLEDLRGPITPEEREMLFRNYYKPHHAAFEHTVTRTLAEHGRCLVVDCHSFPDKPLPYELVSSSASRPDICIGSDPFHSRDELISTFCNEFQQAGYSVSINDPFAGAIVPMTHYSKDKRVEAIMVEVNRRLYLKSGTSEKTSNFDEHALQIRQCCISAIDKVS